MLTEHIGICGITGKPNPVWDTQFELQRGYIFTKIIPRSPFDTAPPAARTGHENELHQTAECKTVNVCLHVHVHTSDQERIICTG